MVPILILFIVVGLTQMPKSCWPKDLRRLLRPLSLIVHKLARAPSGEPEKKAYRRNLSASPLVRQGSCIAGDIENQEGLRGAEPNDLFAVGIRRSKLVERNENIVVILSGN